MLIREYRIVMPLTVSEYQIGQLYSTVKASKNETGGGEGVEIVETSSFSNEPLLEGQTFSGVYTNKIYHLERKAPTFLRLIVPSRALKLHEESWNAYPYCRTLLNNPEFMGDDFFLYIESIHLEGHTNEENALRLPPDKLEHREVVFIDIAKPIKPRDYNASEDPTLFRSVKTGRGPLQENWMESTPPPLMTCYKVVTIDCKWWGLQKKIESILQNMEFRLFSVFSRQIFCWMDEWWGLRLNEVQNMERNAQLELEVTRRTGQIRGLTGGNTD